MDGRPCFVGIDPGLDGAIAVIRPDGSAAAWVVPVAMPRGAGRRRFDRGAMVEALGTISDPFVAIERVDAAPMHGRRQGTTSMFRFGEGYGLWLGILESLLVPYVEVSPRSWKKAILAGTARDKAAAVAYVKRFHPGVDLRATPRCRTEHDGMADAICLAEYARMEWTIRSATRRPGGTRP